MFEIRRGHYSEPYYGAYEVVSKGDKVTRRVWFYWNLELARENDHSKASYMVVSDNIKNSKVCQLSIYTDEHQSGHMELLQDIEFPSTNEEDFFIIIEDILENIGIRATVFINK